MKPSIPSTQPVRHTAPGPARLDAALRNDLGWQVLVAEGDRLISWTPEIGAQLGLSRDSLGECLVSSLNQSLRQIIFEAAEGGLPVTAQRVLLRTPSAVAGPFHVCALPARLPAGGVQVTVVLSEISASEATERTIRRLDRLASMGTLSASMAHEVRNAFVAIKTFVDLLLEKNQDDELAGVVRREMTRIDSLVSQMLKFSVPAPAAPRPMHVHDTMSHSLRMVQHHVDGRLISLDRRFNAPDDSIMGDDHQLEQAFLNLLINAIEAMGSNGTLTVATARADVAELPPVLASRDGKVFLKVSVTDTGVGITPENQKHLFEPFFTTKPNGTGLGLAISRKIVEEHGGQFAVRSEPNKGSTFSVFLPALPAAK